MRAQDFWYHPFEAHAGHQLGILMDCLMLWQSTIIYTHAHRYKLWTLCLELLVLPHSALIAFTRSNGVMAGQFGFGYLLILLFHQMHAASFTRLQRVLLVLVAVISIGLTYQTRVLKGLPGTRFEAGKGFRDAFEIVFMPVLHFAVSFLVLPLVYILLKPLVTRLPSKRAQAFVAIPIFMVLAWGTFFGIMLFIFSLTGGSPASNATAANTTTA